MKITVLTPTYRLLYKERQLKALSRQTLGNFEWVIVDDSYEQNKGIRANFPIIHIPPIMIVPYFALASALNDGITHASGKYVFFMNDYVVPDDTCLERHWEVQEKVGGCLLSGRTEAMDEVPKECLNEKGGIVSWDYRLSLFEKGFFPSTLIEDNLYEVPRSGVENWWSGRNDSCPLEALLACNGFDETFDGRWGGQDADMAHRLMTYGLKYYLDKKSLCREYAHPRGSKRECRTEVRQRDLSRLIISEKMKEKIYEANRDFFVVYTRKLREENQICLKQ